MTISRKYLICLAAIESIARVASAQYLPSTSGSTVAAAEMDRKLATASGGGAPTTSCTAGKEVWLDTTGHQLYFCSQTNTWVVLVQQAALDLKANSAAPTFSGVVGFAGSTSGVVSVKAPDIAGAALLTLPSASGTIAATSGSLTNGNCPQFDASGLIVDSGSPCGGGGGPGFTDFTPTKTSGSVVTVAAGKYIYGTNFVNIASPVTFTLLQPSISSVAVGVNVQTTTIVTSSPVSIANGQALSITLTGTGLACPLLNGIFVATLFSSTSFGIPVNMQAGCTGVSGTVGTQSGGVAIIFGNNSGNVELDHSATMGAMVAAAGANAVTNQSSTASFPNGSVPIAYITIAAGAFDTVTDYRAQMRGMQVQSGAGIDVVLAGGQAQVNVASNVALVDQPSTWVNSVNMKDATKTLPWRTGTGSPNARDICAYLGEAYFQTDTPTLWTCTVTGTPGTWASVASGGGGAATARDLNGPGISAKCQAPVAAAAFSLPAANAPTATCETDGIQAYLAFTANTAQTAYDRFTLPADWTGALKLVLTGYSTSTNAPTIAVQLSCIATAATASPTFGTAQTISFTPLSASGRKSVSTTLSTTNTFANKACVAGDMVTWKLAITAAAAADLRTLSVRFTE